MAAAAPGSRLLRGWAAAAGKGAGLCGQARRPGLCGQPVHRRSPPPGPEPAICGHRAVSCTARQRKHLDAAQLGVPVVAAGIPPLDGSPEGADLVVAPRDLDGVIAHGSCTAGASTSCSPSSAWRSVLAGRVSSGQVFSHRLRIRAPYDPKQKGCGRCAAEWGQEADAAGGAGRGGGAGRCADCAGTAFVLVAGSCPVDGGGRSPP